MESTERTTSPLPTGDLAAFARDTSVPEIIAALLWQRGLHTPESVAAFLNPCIEHLHAPELLLGMAAAADRIAAAVQRRENILIYGDYDVDGTFATVLLKTAIDRVTPTGVPSLVRYHIPHRLREGYGMQAEVLRKAAAAGVRLVISVDTGMRAFAAAEESVALGLDLIVTDHHLPESGRVPQAVAVINPNQPACTYPNKHLCGAAVAYKLGELLLCRATDSASGLRAVSQESLPRLSMSLLKLVAIATIADAVPLLGENRAMVSLGLAAMRSVKQPGLRALMRLAEVAGDGSAATAEQIAFRLAPRINAAGRMDVATDVVELLLTSDEAEAERLALKLHTLNTDRRAVESEIFSEICSTLDAAESAYTAADATVSVLDGAGWHRGVLGILASRVVEKTGCPALVASHIDGETHGSGRSVEGFHLLDALTAVNDEHQRETTEPLFHRFGGHAQAVGFSLPPQNVAALRRRLGAYPRSRTSAPETAVGLGLKLRPGAIDFELWQWLCRMQPFGNGNQEPVFRCDDLTVVEVKVLKDRHAKLRLNTPDGHVFECLFWARAFAWPQRLTEMGVVPGSKVDLEYQVRWRTFPVDGPEFTAREIRQLSTGSIAPHIGASEMA